jgi:hypothetical protein
MFRQVLANPPQVRNFIQIVTGGLGLGGRMSDTHSNRQTNRHGKVSTHIFVRTKFS